MRSALRLAVLALGLLALGPASAAEDRLGVPGPIAFAGARYALAFADTPQPGYVKQEYLPSGQTLERFEAMMLVEFMPGEATPAEIARAQTRMLDERRAFDPLANYAILLADDGNAVILDFLLSAEIEDGLRVAEWNAYRYVAGNGPEGERGGWLVGISRRAYGDAITPFLERLRDARSADVAALATLRVLPIGGN